MTLEQIAALFAMNRDTLRAQLDALQSGDELPELKPYPEIPALNKRGAWNEWAQSYARQAQAMARAKMLAELGKVKPIGYLAWRDGKPCWDGDDCVCEDAVYPIDSDDDRESMAIYTRPLPAQDGNAELVEALEMLCNGLEWNIENHPTVMNQSDEEALHSARTALANAKAAQQKGGV